MTVLFFSALQEKVGTGLVELTLSADGAAEWKSGTRSDASVASPFFGRALRATTLSF
ncbi:MAG: hypothetical protein ABEL97_10715 [Salinibacter sp.]